MDDIIIIFITIFISGSKLGCRPYYRLSLFYMLLHVSSSISQ